jgi:hypothetical protein
MEVEVAKLPSLHGLFDERRKEFACFIRLTTLDNGSNRWITLPFVSLKVEKQLREFERYFCKFFDKQELADCVGQRAELVSLLGDQAIILKRDGKELNTAKWCLDTFKKLYEVGILSYIKETKLAIDEANYSANNRIDAAKWWLELAKG